jgi:hypothetical protein
MIDIECVDGRSLIVHEDMAVISTDDVARASLAVVFTFCPQQLRCLDIESAVNDELLLKNRLVFGLVKVCLLRFRVDVLDNVGSMLQAAQLQRRSVSVCSTRQLLVAVTSLLTMLPSLILHAIPPRIRVVSEFCRHLARVLDMLQSTREASFSRQCQHSIGSSVDIVLGVLILRLLSIASSLLDVRYVRLLRRLTDATSVLISQVGDC